MRAEYKKEPGKIYLVIKPEDEEHAEYEFAVKMLSENKIEGLLSFEKRIFNGEIYFFYDVSGKQAIQADSQKEEGMQRNLLSGKELCRLLQSLYCLAERARSYFLEIRGIVLDPELIFSEKENFYFCYDPSVQEDNGKQMEKFAELLLTYIDHDDSDAVVTGYQFYKLVKAGDKAILQILEEVLAEEVLTEEGAETEDSENLLWEEAESVDHMQESEKKTGKKMIKCDVGTFLCFFLLLIVSLSYLFECFILSGGKSSLVMMRKQEILAVFFILLSIPGMAAGIVNIDIKGKK